MEPRKGAGDLQRGNETHRHSAGVPIIQLGSVDGSHSPMGQMGLLQRIQIFLVSPTNNGYCSGHKETGMKMTRSFPWTNVPSDQRERSFRVVCVQKKDCVRRVLTVILTFPFLLSVRCFTRQGSLSGIEACACVSILYIRAHGLILMCIVSVCVLVCVAV